MRKAHEYVRLDGQATSLVLALYGGQGADLVYLGARLPDGEDLGALCAAQQRSVHENQPDIVPMPGLLPERKAGWKGTPAVGLMERRAERIYEVQTDFELANWTSDKNYIRLTFMDAALNIHVQLAIEIRSGDVITFDGCIFNSGARDFELTRFAPLTLAIPPRFCELTHFSGRWAGEMRETRRALGVEGYASQSTAGKPGFAGGNWLLLHDPASGEAMGAHLAWSGDYETRIEADQHGSSDGRAQLQMGQNWDCGEVPLTSDPELGVNNSCKVCLALAPDRSTLAQKFHTLLRRDVLADRKAWPARKVHLNSWEALGFDLSEAKLKALADDAAALGAERFVLDDGWFGGRRNDRTSLGDWTVSSDLFPSGLTPLIDHVHALGMDFGLWVEPEMVSPDSDLYREHPDWCLHKESKDRPTMRGQLVLDLRREKVCDHLFAKLSSLLGEHAIAYLKWDHNRDVFPRSHAQTERLYALIDRLRSAHPEVEIESCASGGGRIDYGILARTHRVWPSDNNDPLERVRIIRAWSQFLPLEVLGNHVGPSPNPITGRRTCMDFRSKVALFGHMGIEADPRAMSAEERTVLAAHIALYKNWRDTQHSGDLWRLEHPDAGVGGMMVTHENKALALVTQTGFAAHFDAAPIRLAGLDAASQYCVTLPDPWPAKAANYLAGPERWREGLTLTGRALMTQGLALPLTHPETAWLIALEKVS
ncbi:MAG: alpha-galactosidase [Pseudomonadota bacterium]